MSGMDKSGKDQLRSYIERAERLQEEKDVISEDLRELFAEAKSNGFDVKALRTVIRMRKQDANERAEQAAIVETYLHALGMLADTPLGQAAVERAKNDPAERRAARSRARSTESMRDTAELSQEMADAGMISQESADETKRIADAVDRNFGKKGFRRDVADMVTKAFGEPAPLTEDEKAKGYTAAFIKDGNRVAMGFNMAVPSSPAPGEGRAG